MRDYIHKTLNQTVKKCQFTVGIFKYVYVKDFTINRNICVRILAAILQMVGSVGVIDHDTCVKKIHSPL